MTVTIKWNKMGPNAKIPTEAYGDPLCFDLFAAENVNLMGHDGNIMVGTQLRAIIPEGYGIEFKERSGMAFKGVALGAGEIDSDYRGELKVLLRYTKSDMFQISVGDKICQARLVKKIDRCHEEIDDSTFEAMKTERGAKGFGSSDS